MSRRLNQLMSFSDNCPDSLLLVCVKYVVKQELDIRGISLPQEICDLLIEVSLHSIIFFAINYPKLIFN